MLYRPGVSCSVRYRVQARNRAGHPRVASLCGETRHRPGKVGPIPDEFEGRYQLPEPAERRGPNLVWAFPYDPSLPGLPDAAWGPAVRHGLTNAGQPVRAVAVEPLRYRPRRRAVFRYTGIYGGRPAPRPGSFFGKVLRRSKALRLSKLSVSGANGGAIRLAMPLTGSEAMPFLFAPLEGRSLRSLLLSGGSLPTPERVSSLLDDVPEALSTGEDSERSPAEMLGAARELLTRLVPGDRMAVERVAETVEEGAARDRLPRRRIHGDLYEAQIFVGRGFGLGLIDLDDAGIGDPAMDAANLSAHLVALALAVPGSAPRILAYRTLVRRSLLGRLDLSPSELAWREGLCMLLLSTGPFRVLAKDWPRRVSDGVRIALRLSQQSR